ncbi:hypothetical protein TL16_g13177 [Triparma laevis f. inornata]|uniref:Uncharacterized protein n=1 Tax=Triparma laevis f. inornata TaxID=1714386 RepID=A0A9W7C004_9STRA|nr:hypothetical protein TL16_g13177 [Triparma laevis f. inornata]
MKLNVTVEYGNLSKNFLIPVGDGDKTIKCLRSREQRPITGGNTQLMPNTIYSAESVFYHPDAIINTKFQDRQEVTVELINRIAVNAVGPEWDENPVQFRTFLTSEFRKRRMDDEANGLRRDKQDMTEDQRKREDERNANNIMMDLEKNKHKLDPNSDPFKLKEQFEVTLPKFGELVMARWAFIAFKRSEHQAKARSGVATRQLDEIEEARLEKEEVEKQRRLKEAAMKVWEMRQVMKPQLRDEAMAEEVMMEEWGHMSKGAIIDKVRTKGNAIVGHGSNINEDIQRIFLECHVQDEETVGQVTLQSELHIHEFLLAIIDLAVFLNISLAQKGGRSSVAKARGGKKKKLLSQSEALEKLYEDALQPYIQKVALGPSIKSALGTDEVLLLFREHDEELKKTFRIYGERFEERGALKGANMGNTMNIHEFGNLIADSGLMKRTSNKSSDELTKQEVRQAFSAAQHDSAADADEKAAVAEGTRSSHLTQMTYCEFLEAVARIGAAKWEGEITLFKKIERAIKAVVALLEHPDNARYV